MDALLEGRLAPIGHAFAFLQAPLSVTRDALVSWRRQHQHEVVWRSIDAPLSVGLRTLEPLTTLRRRELLFQTRSSWTACFDNGVRGGDPFPIGSYLPKVLNCRGLIVSGVPHQVRGKGRESIGTLGAVQFALYGPEEREWLNLERAVAVAHDGRRWEFSQSGTPMSFERTECYDHGRIRDRFAPAMLQEYCLALGIRLFDEDFYGPAGVLVSIADPLPSGHSAYSLDEARSKIGLPPVARG